MSQTQPGWYPQPDGQERYWDGAQWTQQTRPAQTAPGAVPPPPAAGATPMSHRDAKKLAKATRPWWKKKRFMLPLLLLLFIAGISKCMNGGSSTSTSTGSATGSSPSTSAVAVAGIGQKVKEGDIEFTINSWKCGATTVGTDPFVEKAQGQFCIADVVYTNVGKEPKTFDASMALTARQGETQYKPSSQAGTAANNAGDDQTFLQQVNPGNSAKGKVVFDVPKGAKIDRVNVVDGFTGDGTPIKVG